MFENAQLARADLDACKRPHHPRATAMLRYVLWQCVYRQMPYKIGTIPNPVPSRRGNKKVVSLVSF